MHANLLNSITHKAGDWFQTAGGCAPALIKLARAEDEVTLAGPLSVNVTVLAENVTQPSAGGLPRAQSQEVSSYDLDIPAGQTWTYRMPDALSAPRLGVNAGYSVAIRPTVPRRPPLVQTAPDVPCDFAVASMPHTGQFFPSGCEGCPPGSVIGVPPTCGPTLDIPTARGGCVRPRFFNGMFLTREDLETQLRYVRLKNRLQNRAAGQGVVWGLPVQRHGNKVRVGPGYAVDCCGNDLTVTCDYDVDVATLLRDPASCHLLTEGPRRLHLLLEYVECPEEPRPVHGDACSPQTTLCEMSRLRETVRLRLVPPRDHEPSGPIRGFLDRLKEHLASVPIDRLPVVGEVEVPAAVIEPLVPFTVKFEIRNPASGQTPVTLQPPVGGTSSATGDIGTNSGFSQVTVTVTAHAGFLFTEGSPALSPPVTPVVVVSDTPAAKIWVAPVVMGQPITLQFRQWKARRPDGTEASGTTDMRLESRRGPPPGGGSIELHFHVEVPPTDVVVVNPGPWPCFSEACDPQGKPRFPVLPPWSHEDPLGRVIPADPRVLALSVLYSLLTLAAGSVKDDQAASASPMVQQFARIYRAAWLVLFRLAPDTEQRRLSALLRNLLAEWCHGLLYPGPKCQGEPHGVVIGCALVKAGDICSVDSWGGRRWVVHYPLLAHWGEQFGLTPPDVLASRLFDFICCLAELRLPPLPSREKDQPPASTTHFNTAVFPVGPSYLMFGTRQDVLAWAEERKMRHVRDERMGLLDFISLVVAGTRSPGDPGGPFVLYQPAGFANVFLAAPDRAQKPPAVVVRPGRGRVTRLVRPSFLAPAGVAVPSLLRGFAEDLTVELLDEVPVTPVAGDQSPLLEPLGQAGITAVGAVLARDPEAVHEQVLNRAHTPELTKLLEGSEKMAHVIARSVGETILKRAGELATRNAFKNDQDPAVIAFDKELAERLPRDVPREAVPRATQRAAHLSPEREE